MRVFGTVLLLVAFNTVASERVESVKCGSSYVGQMFGQGWRLVKADYIAEVSSDRIKLDDGSVYRADMTSGMLSGDKALLLAKYVRSGKQSGYIYTLCAGGFDAWVTQVK